MTAYAIEYKIDQYIGFFRVSMAPNNVFGPNTVLLNGPEKHKDRLD
jgi:hypothetical protein